MHCAVGLDDAPTCPLQLPFAPSVFHHEVAARAVFLTQAVQQCGHALHLGATLGRNSWLRAPSRTQAEAEAGRQAVYEELAAAEDEMRALREEAGARAARAAHLEHVVRAKACLSGWWGVHQAVLVVAGRQT
jgi:hypothetical protein